MKRIKKNFKEILKFIMSNWHASKLQALFIMLLLLPLVTLSILFDGTKISLTENVSNENEEMICVTLLTIWFTFLGIITILQLIKITHFICSVFGF